MIRLGLMLERSREYESTFDRPDGARRFREVRDGAVWYLGIPFCPRRAIPRQAVPRRAAARTS